MLPRSFPLALPPTNDNPQNSSLLQIILSQLASLTALGTSKEYSENVSKYEASPLFICAMEHDFSNCGTLTATCMSKIVAFIYMCAGAWVLKLWYAYHYWFANHCRHYFTSAMEHGSQTVVRSPLLICQPLFTITRLNKQPKRKNNKHF